MDLGKLFNCHRAALIDSAEGPNAEARQWAEECADYYGRRLVAMRDRLEVPIPTFDHRHVAR
jgi:hypothetical protein